MTDTEIQYSVEPSPAAIARAREIISRFSFECLPDLPGFTCKRCGREIYCGAGNLRADPLYGKK